MASTTTQIDLYKQLPTRVAGYFRPTPRRFVAILVGCELLAVLVFCATFTTSSGIQKTVQAVGRDSAPSIIAAEQIQACLASADANGLNATLIHAPQESDPWSRYRKDMNCAHEALISASQNITYGSTQRAPISKIESALGEYEYLMGQARDHVDGPITSDLLFQQEIRPASNSLNKSTYARLNQVYQTHRGSISRQIPLVWFSFLILIGALGAAQWYLVRRTRRVINIGFAVASALTILVLIFSAIVLNTGEAQLETAKQHSLDNINALWSAKAIAYDMNALESLYMMHYGDTAKLIEDEQSFTNFAMNIVNIDPLAAVTNAEYQRPFGGYLGAELSHTSYPGERDAAINAVEAWAAYINIDSQMRDLMKATAAGEASYFNAHFLQGQSSLAFNQFDRAISRVIAINQRHFDEQINSALSTLQILPFVLIAWLIGFILACFYGMKPRLDEYRA
jgi:hypothetical protein